MYEKRGAKKQALISKSLRSETIILGVVGVFGVSTCGELTLARLLNVASRRKRNASWRVDWVSFSGVLECDIESCRIYRNISNRGSCFSVPARELQLPRTWAALLPQWCPTIVALSEGRSRLLKSRQLAPQRVPPGLQEVAAQTGMR
jgi:hypothetical protein